MSKFLHFDINMTGQCNLRCTYCTEAGNDYSPKNCDAIIPSMIVFFDRVLQSDLMKQYDGLCINFWGGEPTLKTDSIIELVEHFQNNPKVRFMLYTNGFKFTSKLKEKLLELKDKRIDKFTAKFHTQISYDGYRVHNLKRLTVGSSKGSADEVRKTLEWVKENEIPFTIKSTITMDTLKYIYDSYVDVTKYATKNSGYFPTLDYFNDLTNTDKYEEYVNDMKVGLKKIAAHMIELKKNNQHVPVFKWFEKSLANCSAGTDMFVIDVDGKIYACHGCLYSTEKDEHFVQSIYDADFSGINESAKLHSSCFQYVPKECSTCEATFCVRCNIVRYGTSEKESYQERWVDYTNRPDLCNVYKEVGKIARAYRKIISK